MASFRVKVSSPAFGRKRSMVRGREGRGLSASFGEFENAPNLMNHSYANFSVCRGEHHTLR
jgi:hypothetical protein